MHYSFTLKKPESGSLPKESLVSLRSAASVRDNARWWGAMSLHPAAIFAMALKGDLFKNLPLPGGDGPKSLGKFDDAKPFDYARWKSGFKEPTE